MDRIVVFVSGKIVEDGDLNTLLRNKDSHFYKMWEMQAEGFIPPVSELLSKSYEKFKG
ncbi:MAG: ABC transporter ATP-binding protein [Tatlockia sp.]|nr:ABC transporter ATP-binding protein [Tatlockia sp.]